MTNFHAYVLLRTDPLKTENCFKRLCDTPGVKRAHYTVGHYDTILWVEGKDEKDLFDIITNKVRKIEGVCFTETLWVPEELNKNSKIY